MNDAYQQLSGYGRDEVIGNTVADLDIYSDPHRRAEMLRLLSESGSVRNYEIRAQGKYLHSRLAAWTTGGQYDRSAGTVLVVETSSVEHNVGLRILAVDDQVEALELLALALEGTPHQLIKANNGVDVLELLAREQPDLLITDLMMAPLSGFEVIEAVVSDPRLRHIPIIVVTAHDLSAEDIARLNGHVKATLSKRGFDKGRFLRELQRSTGARAAAEND